MTEPAPTGDQAPVPAAAAGSERPGGLRELANHPAALFRLGLFPTLGAMTALALGAALVSLNVIGVALVVALFTALGLQPVIDWLMKRGLPRAAAAGLVGLALVVLAGLGLWAIIPLVAQQIAQFAQNAPQLLESLRTNPQIAHLDAQFGILGRARELLSSGGWVTQLFGGVMGAGMAAANLLLTVTLGTVLMIYFTWSAPAIKDAIYAFAPASKRPRVRYLANEVFKRIGDYLLSMLLVMSLWGILTFVVLNVVGLGQYSLALALLVAALTAIPAVGSTVGALVCALVALSVSPVAAGITLVALLGYQQVDAYVVQPRLFARSLQVPPALVILGAACGLTLFGLVGALLAIPTVASLLLLYRELVAPKLDAA